MINLDPHIEATKGGAKVLLKFSAPWCNNCKNLSKILPNVLDESVEVIEVDTDHEIKLVGYFNVMSIPTLVVVGTDTNYKGWNKMSSSKIDDVKRFLSDNSMSK